MFALFEHRGVNVEKPAGDSELLERPSLGKELVQRLAHEEGAEDRVASDAAVGQIPASLTAGSWRDGPDHQSTEIRRRYGGGDGRGDPLEVEEQPSLGAVGKDPDKR